jgi:hypothetical protein
VHFVPGAVFHPPGWVCPIDDKVLRKYEELVQQSEAAGEHIRKQMSPAGIPTGRPPFLDPHALLGALWELYGLRPQDVPFPMVKDFWLLLARKRPGGVKLILELFRGTGVRFPIPSDSEIGATGSAVPDEQTPDSIGVARRKMLEAYKKKMLELHGVRVSNDDICNHKTIQMSRSQFKAWLNGNTANPITPGTKLAVLESFVNDVDLPDPDPNFNCRPK